MFFYLIGEMPGDYFVYAIEEGYGSVVGGRVGRFVFVKERKVRGGPVRREWVEHEVVGDPSEPSFDAWGC